MARAAPTSPAISVSSTSSQDGPSPVPVPRYVRRRDMKLPRVRSRPCSRAGLGGHLGRAAPLRSVLPTSAVGTGATGRRGRDVDRHHRRRFSLRTGGAGIRFSVRALDRRAVVEDAEVGWVGLPDRGRPESGSTGSSTSGVGGSSRWRRQKGIREDYPAVARSPRSRAASACASSSRRLMTRLTESSPTVTP